MDLLARFSGLFQTVVILSCCDFRRRVWWRSSVQYFNRTREGDPEKRLVACGYQSEGCGTTEPVPWRSRQGVEGLGSVGPLFLHHISGFDAVVFSYREQVEGVRCGFCDTVGWGHCADSECAAPGRQYHLLPELERFGILLVSSGCERASVPSE